jgi:two-component system, chemotaxis family, sensor kinase CheA
MDTKDQDFLKRLLATFEVEAREHIRAMTSSLIELENTTATDRQPEIIEAIFREAHSLKGAARAVNLAGIEAVCQALESVFAALKRQEIAVSAALCDTLHQTLDSLGPVLVTAEVGAAAVDASRLRAVLQRLESLPKTALVEPRMSEIEARALTPDRTPHPSSLPPHPHR